MRILHIDTGRTMRGGQRQALLLMRALRAAGHQSVLLARERGALEQAAQAEGFRVAGATWRETWRHSRDVDLVHAHDARAHTLALLAARRRVPLVVSRRVAFPLARSAASRWKYAGAARYLAVSEFVAAELRRGGVASERIDVVYDAVEPATQIAWAPSGPAVALESDDPLKARGLIARAARAAGIPVIFSEELARDLADASMFLYITQSEGLGSAALLAMAMGVPVVASAIGGLPEVVEPGVSGLLTGNSEDEIAAAMQFLAGHPEEARRMIAQAKRRVEERFSVAELLRKTMAAYVKVTCG